MATVVRLDVEEVVRHFKQLDDPRSSVNRLHPLESVIVIAIMAVLAGASGPTAIAKWAKMKAELLLKLLDLPHGIPKKDVFRRVLITLKPDAFQACFTMWLTAPARRSRRGYGRGATGSGGRRKDGAAKSRSAPESGGLAFRDCMGERVWPDTCAGGNGGEIERNHGDSDPLVAR